MTSALLVAVLAATPALDVRGNLVFFDQVYVAVANLDEDAVADDATAALVETRVRDFLLRAGYELARVEAEARDNRIVLMVDEGRLGRIVFRGRGTVTTLQLRLSVVLPDRVFNRPEFEKQLETLTTELGIEGATYEVKPVEGTESGFQLEKIPLLPGRALQLGGTHDLYVTLPRADWYSGLRLAIGFNSYVVRLGARMRNVDLLLDDDRWEASLLFGTRLFRGVGIDDDTRVNFNDAALAGRYYTPPFAGGLRPFTSLNADIVRRERIDLNVEQYWWSQIAVGLNLAYELADGAEVALGGGLEYRNLFGAEQSALPPTGLRLSDLTDFEPFVSLEAELIFDPWEMRRDRLHQLSAVARQYGGGFGALDIRYQKVLPFGWNDFWIRSAGALRWGDFAVGDEAPLTSQYLRGVFGDEIYSSTLGSIQLEYRYSLSRDVLKVGVFHDLAVFRESARARNNPRTRVGDSFGFGFHTLLLDFAQLDVYVAAGFVSDGGFDAGLNASFKKAF